VFPYVSISGSNHDGSSSIVRRRLANQSIPSGRVNIHVMRRAGVVPGPSVAIRGEVRSLAFLQSLSLKRKRKLRYADNGR
jgi:hypothetical protein